MKNGLVYSHFVVICLALLLWMRTFYPLFAHCGVPSGRGGVPRAGKYRAECGCGLQVLERLWSSARLCAARSYSSVGEHFVHTEGVTGSIPVRTTVFKGPVVSDRPLFCIGFPRSRGGRLVATTTWLKIPNKERLRSTWGGEGPGYARAENSSRELNRAIVRLSISDPNINGR